MSRPDPTDRDRAAEPARPRDYAALSAGWGAALGTLLVAARDKGDEPVRPAEIVPLGIATFALAKLVAKEKVDALGRASRSSRSVRTAAWRRRATACATRSASC